MKVVPEKNQKRAQIKQVIAEVCLFYAGKGEIIFVNNMSAETWFNIDKNQISQAVENIVIDAISSRCPLVVV